MKKMFILSRVLWNIQTKLAKAVLPYFAAALIFLIVGCGGGGGDSSPQAGTGTVNASLTDAPAGGFTAVNVTIRGEEFDDLRMESLKTLMLRYKGGCRTKLHIILPDLCTAVVRLPEEYSVTPTEGLSLEVEGLLGYNAVSFE